MIKHFNKLVIVAVVATVLFGLVSVVGAAFNNGERLATDPDEDEVSVRWVSHTEYWSSSGPGSSELASTIIRVTDYRGDPFTVDNCQATVLYPDKSVYVNNQSMSQSGVAGNWYRTDSVPDIEGTYEQQVTCNYGSGKTIKTSNSFHVNPALNFLKNVSADLLSTSAKLSNVNISITGTVENAQASINTNIDTAETNLDNLMDSINESLSNQLTTAEGNLDTQLTDVSATIRANIADTNESLITRIDLAETNLDNLINDVDNNLTNQLINTETNLDTKLENVRVNLTALMNNVNAELTTRIDTAETNLDSLLNEVNSNLSNQLAGAKSDLSSQLKNVNISLQANLGNTQTAIQTQLSNINDSLDNLITTLNNDIKSYLVEFLPEINNTANKIYTDSQWIVNNAMNQEDNAVITQRFNSIDGNLSLIEGFCDNAQTNSSLLCRDIFSLKTTLDTVRDEQTTYFNTLDNTTTSTWNLLSGTIYNNIDTIIAELNIIKGQTVDINATVHSIRDDQEARVYANIIS
jgi:F0F1-type ATP synthase membrane subunit b/b'